MVTPKPRREWRIKKLARLAVFGMTVSLGLGLVAARSVYGDVRSAAFSMGRELGQLGDVGTKRPLKINGEPIFIASTTEDVSVKEVLDQTEARCKLASAGMAAELANLSESLKQKLPSDLGESRAAGILRDDRGDSGVVACLIRDDGAPASGVADITARLGAMLKTGDLGAVGRLRYVFAEKTSTGRTHVVAAWTDGSFNLYALLPSAGKDAPGSDAQNAPRPPNAQRILSADIEGVPYAVRIYDSTATPAEIVKLYDTDMPGRGWSPAYGVPGEGPDQRAFTRPGADLMVITSRDGARTLVSIIEMVGK
ncbi:Hypothetical protein A7982_09834 [Minicystis rosea]|nr:Hypothetical protein A7982_09834 [Minicystis rosea]